MTSRLCLFLFRQRIPRSRGAVPKTSCSTARGKHEEAQKRAPSTSLDSSHSLLGTSVSHSGGSSSFCRSFTTSGSRTEATGQLQSTHYHLVYTCKVTLYSRLCLTGYLGELLTTYEMFSYLIVYFVSRCAPLAL